MAGHGVLKGPIISGILTMNKVENVDEQAVIMVVDDDENMRGMLRDALTRLGYTVVEAENGLKALSLFEAAIFDLVLLDVMMPDINGFDVCTAMRGLPGRENVPIVMLTGINEVSAISRAYEVGATDFLTKGTSWLILNERIRYVLRASRAVERLRTSETRLAKAQQIADLGSWEWDIDHRSFYCSWHTLEICGLDVMPDSMSYEDLLHCVHPDDREQVDRTIQQAIQRRASCQLDHRIIRPDGSERIVLHHLDFSEEQDGPVRRIAGTIQDITRRKQTEQLEEDRNQALEMIIRSEPLKELLMHIVQMLERQRPEGVASVSLAKDNQLFLGAGPRLPEEFAQAMEGVAIEPMNGSAAAAAYYRDAAVAANIEESPHWETHRALAGEHQLRSAVALPILSGAGGVLGTVELYYRNPLASSAADLELLAMAGKLVAIAMEQGALNERLIHESHHDTLTELPNRLLLADRLEHSLAWGGRYDKKVALVCINLDRFKHINDSLGHHVGDQLLRQVAERLRACTRLSDTLARTGGDEFTLVLDGIDDPHRVSSMAARVLASLNPAFLIDQRELYVSASIGISVSPDDGVEAPTLLRNADTAMHFAKSQGGNRYQYFDADMNAAVSERLELENDLRKALERGEFELVYQPQYELGSKRLVGAEALLRWTHPDKGRIPPNKFIPIAEETGLIVPIGTWVLREACAKNASWQSAGYAPFNVAVNVSGVQLLHVDFVDTVAEVLQDTGLSAKWLQLDVTERVIIQDFDTVTKRLAELRTLGVSIAIDDFGTGYSTMAYVQWLPVDCLKIDSSFVQDVSASDEGSTRSKNLIKAFVGLAESFGLQILAEGVESQEQFDFLREVGCEGGQGYLLDTPMSASELTSLCEDFMKSIK
jgi:diguanylate cyclase (GGDEF)-like protein/PAS domain S-box-containing protein